MTFLVINLRKQGKFQIKNCLEVIASTLQTLMKPELIKSAFSVMANCYRLSTHMFNEASGGDS